MKKKVYMAVLTLAFAGLFAGCGKKAEDPGVSVKDDVVEFVNVELPAAKTDHDNAIAIYNAYFADTGSQDLDTFKTSLQPNLSITFLLVILSLFRPLRTRR